MRIRYVSGESPYDPEFFDRKEIEERIRVLVEKYHPTAEYIRRRRDGKNGYEIEKNRISA